MLEQQIDNILMDMINIGLINGSATSTKMGPIFTFRGLTSKGMEYIRVTKENLEKEHICCAISNNKDIQVSSKKAWLADRFDEGLVFLKSVERGKCFIEYIPAECAWNPIEAPGYMYINCLWVSGSFKGHGYSSVIACNILDCIFAESRIRVQP